MWWQLCLFWVTFAHAQVLLIQPQTDTNYIDSFPVQWHSLGGVTPTLIQVVAQYVTGYAQPTPPPELVITLSSGYLGTAGTAWIQPCQLTHMDSMTPSPFLNMADGTYTVFLVYSTNHDSEVMSESVTISTTCATIPAQILSPVHNTYYGDPLIEFRIYLPSMPSALAPITARIYNETMEMNLVLASVSQTIQFTFVTDTRLLQLGYMVLSVTPAMQLENGTYSLSVTYADNHNHAAVTSSITTFSLGPPPPAPVCPPCQPYNVTTYLTREVIVNRSVIEYRDREVIVNRTVLVNTTCDPCPTCAPVTESSSASTDTTSCPDFIFAGKPGVVSFLVFLVLSCMFGCIITTIACLRINRPEPRFVAMSHHIRHSHQHPHRISAPHTTSHPPTAVPSVTPNPPTALPPQPHSSPVKKPVAVVTKYSSEMPNMMGTVLTPVALHQRSARVIQTNRNDASRTPGHRNKAAQDDSHFTVVPIDSIAGADMLE